MSRPLALMMPAVTVDSSPKGLPIASTQSPTLTDDESPNCAAGSLRPASILMTARSVRVSLHNHVIIRQDVPAGIKDDPGAQTAALEMLRRAGFAEMEEMVEEIVIGRVALRAEPAIGNTHRGFRVDVDDGGLDHLCNPRKAVRKLDRRGRRQGLGIGCSA